MDASITSGQQANVGSPCFENTVHQFNTSACISGSCIFLAGIGRRGYEGIDSSDGTDWRDASTCSKSKCIDAPTPCTGVDFGNGQTGCKFSHGG